MEFIDLIQNLGSIGAIIAFIAAALVFLKGSVYKGAIAALESTVSAQEAELTTLKSSNEFHTREIKRLTAENIVLLSQRPSADLINDLQRMLVEHRELVKNNHTEEMNILRGLK